MDYAITSKITEKMIDFYKGSTHDIEHFLKVTEYAKLISALENLDDKTFMTLEISAIVHDISCPLCREKYGSAYGNKQEEESEALLRPFFEEFNLDTDMLERVIYLVCHHHTTTGVDGIDYQILLEADFLVNASESKMDKTTIQNFYDRVVKTDSGKRLFESIYLR